MSASTYTPAEERVHCAIHGARAAHTPAPPASLQVPPALVA